MIVEFFVVLFELWFDTLRHPVDGDLDVRRFLLAGKRRAVQVDVEFGYIAVFFVRNYQIDRQNMIRVTAQTGDFLPRTVYEIRSIRNDGR